MEQAPEQDSKTAEPSASVGSILIANCVQLFQDVIVPVRVILATLIVSVAFLLADQAFLYIIEWTAQDIKSRIPFVAWLLDGVQVLSLVGIGMYFIISGIKNLQTQWNVTRNIEERAGLQ